MYKKIFVCGLGFLLVLSGVIALVNFEEEIDVQHDESIDIPSTEIYLIGDDNRISTSEQNMVTERTTRWERRGEGLASFLGEVNYDERSSPTPSINQHTEHDPIYIDGNDDFATQAASEGWPGSGTEGDPWIIEGYDINATDYENAIYIGNVDAHFIIRNCVLYDAMLYDSFNPPYQWPSGIQLNSTENGTIEENEIFSNGAGIFVKGAGDNILINNTAYGNGVGIMLFETSYNGINGNTYWGNYYGAIGLWDNTYSYIAENNMTDNGILIFGDILEFWNTHTIDTSNTVNGNPVYYWKNQTVGTVPLNAGQIILTNCTDIIVSSQEEAWAIQLGHSEGCLVESNTLYPAMIDLSSSDKNTIRDNEISHDTWDALAIASGSNNNTVVNNTFFDSDVGIFIEFSSNGNVIAYNNISGNYDEGIMVEESMYNHIYENEVYGNNWGIALGRDCFSNIVENNTVYDNVENGIEMFDGASDNVVRNNDVLGGEIGIYCWLADWNLIEQNIISYTSWIGINLGMSNHNIVQNNHISDSNDSAFHIWNSHQNQIQDNTILNNNGWTALGLYDSTDNVIFGNTASNNDNAIHLSNSSYNVIEYNDISDGSEGVNLWESYENHILNNTITRMGTGIYIHHSYDNLISGNEIKENDHGIQVWDSHWNHISNNTISYNDHQGINIQESDMNTITYNTIHNNTDEGIYLSQSNGNHMEGNLISNNNYGILMGASMDNVIYDNRIYNSVWHGMRMWHSEYNVIYQNNISDNYSGIEIQESGDNKIIYNFISNHPQNGIQIFDSNGNEIYHNSFVNNNNHAWDEGGYNYWDNGYPSGGNYWDIHTGPDNYGGPGQNEQGPDGIVDDPYDISGGGNQDIYPLVESPVRLQFSMDLFAPAESDGWQFVSLPVILDNTYIAEFLEPIEGSYEHLMYYDTHADEWTSYVPGRTEHYNNLHSWDHNMGIWIKMNEDVTLTLEGRLPTVTSIALLPGWNMVGLPSETSGNHGLPTEVTRVGYFDATVEYNLAYDYEPATFVFEPGQGYWIYNGADEHVIWTVEY